jgi:hypothetical protein
MTALNRVAADVNPLIISQEKFEPAHAGCHIILGWTIGGSAYAARAVSSALAGNIGDVFDGASNTTAGAVERGNMIGLVSAKLDAGAALAASGALPENVNYAVKSSLLLSFLKSVPVVSARLKAPVTADRKFEDVVKSAQDAAVLVLVY